MPSMKNKFGDIVEIPEGQVQMALNSGYTYVNQQSSQPLAQNPTQSAPPLAAQDYQVVGGTFHGTKEQYDNYIATHPQTQQAVSQFTVGQRIYGSDAVAAAQAAGYTLKNGMDVGSSWPSYTIGSAPASQQPQLPPSSEKVLDLIVDDLVKKPINPNVEISPALMAQYLQQAKTELGPYFSQLVSQAQKDLQTGFQQIGEDLQTNEKKLETSYGQQVGNLQEQMASRGLTFSTKRIEGERTLAKQTQQAIEAGRREASRRAMDLGTQGERTLGSQNLNQLPGIEDAPTPIINRPGVLTFARPDTSRSLFSPIGGTAGTLQQQQLLGETARQKELAASERSLRGNYTI